MYKFVFFLAIFVFTTDNASASGYQKYHLVIPDRFKTEEYKNDLKKWRLSLLEGLGYDESEITEAVFLKTNIPLNIDSKEVVGLVYQNKESPSQYYVIASHTIVDFNIQKVGSMGVAGISTHPTPSKRMVIVLAPSKAANLLGVTLDFSGKVQAKAPVFKTQSVQYEWYSR